MASPAPQKVGPLVEDWTCLDVARWLKQSGHAEVTTAFLASRVDGPLLLELTLNDMEQMGMQAVVRRRLAKQIDTLARSSGVVRAGCEDKRHQHHEGGGSQLENSHQSDGVSRESPGSSSGSSKDTESTLPSWERNRAHSVPPGRQAKNLEDVVEPRGRGGGAHSALGRSPTLEYSKAARPEYSKTVRPQWRPAAGDSTWEGSVSHKGGLQGGRRAGAWATTLPNLEGGGGGHSLGGPRGPAVAKKGRVKLPVDVVTERLKCMFHNDEDTFAPLARTTVQAKERKIESLFAPKGDVKTARGDKEMMIGLHEWHAMLEREGIVPDHLPKTMAVHMFSRAIKTEKAQVMKKRSFQVGIRLVASSLGLPLTGLQLPKREGGDAKTVVHRGLHRGPQHGLTRLCGDDEEAAEAVEHFIQAKERRDRTHMLKDEDVGEGVGGFKADYLRTREERLRLVREHHEADTEMVQRVKADLRRKMQALGLKRTNKFRL